MEGREAPRYRLTKRGKLAFPWQHLVIDIIPIHRPRLVFRWREGGAYRGRVELAEALDTMGAV
jgi:hypothetical protein